MGCAGLGVTQMGLDPQQSWASSSRQRLDRELHAGQSVLSYSPSIQRLPHRTARTARLVTPESPVFLWERRNRSQSMSGSKAPETEGLPLPQSAIARAIELGWILHLATVGMRSDSTNIGRTVAGVPHHPKRNKIQRGENRMH